MANADRLIAILAETFGGTEIEFDLTVIERMIDAIEPIAADDIVVMMTGADDAFVGTWEGAEGLRDAWGDWLETFARLRLEVESVEMHGENLLTVARQVGTTRHGVEIEQPSAAVWKFREQRLVRIEFHLDREKALASAREPAAG